ncbi:MAG: LLM class F420-dependent oxidoreductase [Acidimicrobiales bacterium]|nr:LLM class F420-dependent oxidoreductase [Acidimicrobiales bacterium]
MQVGIHLPQYGRVSGPEAITRAARHAEELGFAGVWVSDHLVQPASQDYPSPYLFDPLVTLTWAAAVTRHVGLGTSVLVVPHHNPLELANTLASLDALSGGRLTVGVGVGWSAGEFAALGHEFANRGRRTDEALRLWRAVWSDDPVSFAGEFTSFEDLRVLPKPAHRIPLWIGGSGERALRRAVELGDGFQLIGVTPDEAKPLVERLRRDRPESEFRISLRTGWDPQGMDHDRIRAEREAYEAAGIDEVVAAPWRSDLDAWLRSMELLAGLVDLRPGPTVG